MSRRLPTVTAKQLAKALERAGWRLARVTGNHHFVHPAKRRAVVIPMHPGDLKRPLVAGVLKDAEITRGEFAKLLRGRRQAPDMVRDYPGDLELTDFSGL